MSMLDFLGIDMTTYFPDIPRSYTALAQWLACMQCIMLVKKRHIRGICFAGVSLAMLALQTVFLCMTDGLYGFWWFVCMAGSVALMLFFIYMCCDISGMEAGYCCTFSFMTAEFMASLEWQIDYFFYYDIGWKNGWFRLFWLVLIYGLVLGAVWYTDRRLSSKENKLQITSHELISNIFISLSVFLMSNLGYASIRTPFTAKFHGELFNIRTIVDLGGLAVLYANHAHFIERHTSSELEKIENILHNQHQQYHQAQEVMEVINYKYHDLKHFILALRAEENTADRKRALDRMEAEIEVYEAQNNTGNQVLDTLLTTKNLYCMKHDIDMTYVADGKLLDFMDEMDICSIFGNALDNAVECEEKIPDKEKRMIHITVMAKNKFLIIRVENYYENNLEFDGRFPVTTKEEKRLHGYGLKSLRYTVQKYGGEVDIDTKDNWFIVKVLIPIKEE